MRVKPLQDCFIRRADVRLTLEVGKEIEINDRLILESLAGLVVIVGHYPPKDNYEVLQDFENYKVGQIIPLFSDQAGRWVLEGKVKPTNATLWRPGMQLPSTIRSFSSFENITKGYVNAFYKK